MSSPFPLSGAGAEDPRSSYLQRLKTLPLMPRDLVDLLVDPSDLTSVSLQPFRNSGYICGSFPHDP